MPRLRPTVEQILVKLREAVVALSRGQSAGQTCRATIVLPQPASEFLSKVVGGPIPYFQWIE